MLQEGGKHKVNGKFTNRLQKSTSECSQCGCVGLMSREATRASRAKNVTLTDAQRAGKKCLACYIATSERLSEFSSGKYTAKYCRQESNHSAVAWDQDPDGPRGHVEISGWGSTTKEYTQEIWDKGPYHSGTFLELGALMKAKKVAVEYEGRHYGLLLSLTFDTRQQHYCQGFYPQNQNFLK